MSWIIPPLAECEHPAAPPETAGEYLTKLPSAAGGIAGPTGLGFRTPVPGHLAVQRGRVQVLGRARPHLDAAADRDPVRGRGAEPVRLAAQRHRGHDRRAELTAPPVTTVPSLPATSLGDTKVAEEAVLYALAGMLDVGIPYPLPASNSMPSQATTPARPNVP